jgi:YfiH family protein
LLAELAWLEHGFGTRSDALTQEAMASLKQVHSSVVHVADGRTGCIGEGDALLTDLPNVAVSIRTADCYPILLADPEHHAVAALHAGWRGTAAKIAGEAIARMRSAYGTRAEALHAAIGPGIGACCYAVGIEVAQRFGKDAAGRLDLADENRKQLAAAGVPRIDIAGGCTYCDAERFWSYRRDGERVGRMISFIRVLGK